MPSPEFRSPFPRNGRFAPLPRPIPSSEQPQVNASQGDTPQPETTPITFTRPTNRGRFPGERRQSPPPPPPDPDGPFPAVLGPRPGPKPTPLPEFASTGGRK